MIQDYPNFEIIVSDDCSDDNSVEIIKDLAAIDKRIKLFAHQHHLGMHDNFEFALNQVVSGYVLALGGDDGLVPGCIWRMYEILKNTKKELLTWRLAGFVYSENDGGKNCLYVNRVKNGSIKILKSEDFLNKIADSFQYQINECPMFYMKGVASIELIKKVKRRTPDGSFYYCPTPDGYSGVVLAGEVEDYAYTDEPLTIGGTTTKSQGQNYMRNDEKSKKEAFEFFNDNARRTMHNELASQPYSPLTTLMTADYLLTARDLPGWPGKFKMFKWENLIKASFDCMANNTFASETLVRELHILREISIQHNMLDLFNKLYKNTIRKVPVGKDIRGLAITHSLRIDGSEYSINNIYEASLVTKFLYEFSSKLTLKVFIKMIINSLNIVIQSRKKKRLVYPPID